MKNKVFCFGELLLRLSPVLNGEWIRQGEMPVFIGGAELNVATALAKWNLPVKYSSALPDHYLSHEICEALIKKQIDVSAMHFSGKRIGTYYLPQGIDMKNAGVIYDRAYSSFSELTPGMINWYEVLKDVSWFHFTAINPALTPNVVDVCEEALKVCKEKGITISIDLNYRAKLWQYGKSPVDVMPRLLPYCDVVMGNIWAANSLLGIDVDPEIHIQANKDELLVHSIKTAQAIQVAYPQVKTIAQTFRFDVGEKGISYFATLYKNDNQYISKHLSANEIIDKVGSGDCFMAALIYSLYNELPAQQVINMAACAAFGKLFEKGDTTQQTIEKIQQAANDE
ncbi:sugar kinase [Gynurincola endophyticus]|uniref:sugar kinase n=1 Tax=Gynurincola endophyticus TaxID=2479004 RepID=UPI000F8F65AE|nr:sugar kinase [Gynurincola endophyticus]